MDDSLSPDCGVPFSIKNRSYSCKVVLLNQEMGFGASTTSGRRCCHNGGDAHPQAFVADFFHVAE